jgi:lysozyme
VGVGSKRKRNIANTAGHESYTMNRNVKGRESLVYAFLKVAPPVPLVENEAMGSGSFSPLSTFPPDVNLHAYQPQEAAMETVPGLDVSYWQVAVDWPAVRDAGARFVFIKATEGLGYTDSTFMEKWQGAKDSGLLRGAYHFFHPHQDALQQADRFIRTLRDRDDDGELPCSLDLEVTDGVPNRKIISGVKAWLDEVERRLGRRPMIYSGVSFLESSLSEQGQAPGWTTDYALWLGWFPRKYVPELKPLMPRGWPKWTFWQYSGEGRVRGIDVHVDLDLFNGTLEELQAFSKSAAPMEVSTSHVVAAGETAASIATRYSISLGELMAANPQILKVGEKLSIPRQAPTSPSTSRTHTVKAGETLFAIARKYNTTIAALAARNKIPNPDLIQVGQVLVLS